MDIIQLLSDSLANQIAAGEVVQRPASAVKELLENAIDAGATEVKLLIKEAGRTLVQVIDNGSGMSVTDCRMCFERHATSKIKTTDDLYAIRTKGFRGEALASIAAVAQVSVKSRRAEDELGTLVQIDGSNFINQEAISCPVGTNIEVKNLFFNVPARRKFLKSNPVEMKHIIDEFQRVALAHPEVGFEFYHNDVELHKLPADNLAKRIVDLLGKNYRQQLTACNEQTQYVNITGYIGKPEAAKKTRGDQFFFINNRFVKNNYLHHAVSSAYEGTIPDKSYPFYVLFIEIDPQHIDINIHPQKTEIKFDDEKAVYSILRSSVRQSIGVFNFTPSIDFDSDINFANLTNPNLPEKKPSAMDSWAGSTGHFEKSGGVYRPDKPPTDWRKLYDGLETKTNFERDTSTEESIIVGSKVNTQSTAPEQIKVEMEEVDAVQIHLQYLALQVKSGMLLIDYKAAMERILYEKYERNLQQKAGASQQLLFQKTLNLSPEDFLLAMDLKAEIHALGFGFEEFGQKSIVINGIPAELTDEDAAGVFADLLAQYHENEHNLKLDRAQNLARSLAKRTAGYSQKKLDKREMNVLINRLFECQMPSYTPSGQKIMRIIPLRELAELISQADGF